MNAIGKAKYSVITNIDDIKEEYKEGTTIICSNDYYALQVYFKVNNAKVIGFDNINAIEKYKLPIDSVEYSVTEIAEAALEIIKGKRNEDFIVKHSIVEHKI